MQLDRVVDSSDHCRCGSFWFLKSQIALHGFDCNSIDLIDYRFDYPSSINNLNISAPQLSKLMWIPHCGILQSS